MFAENQQIIDNYIHTYNFGNPIERCDYLKHRAGYDDKEKERCSKDDDDRYCRELIICFYIKI